MPGFINRFFGFFYKLFQKENSSSQSKTGVDGNLPASKFSTPVGRKSRIDMTGLKQPAIQRYYSVPSMPCKASQIQRCSSQISLQQDGTGTPAKHQLTRRNSICGSGDDMSKSFVRRLPGTPVAHQVGKPSVSKQAFEKSETVPKSSHSFETCSIAEGWFDDVMKVSSDCERPVRPNRLYQPRIQHFPHLGYHSNCQAQASSRIPLRKQRIKSNLQDCPNQDCNRFLCQQNRRLALQSKFNDFNEMAVEKEEIGDGLRIGSPNISNWIAYRHDTNTKFEQIFKLLSKKKCSIGNLIDYTTHAQWMIASMVDVDRNGVLFKRFAGGKVVLNCGEYKFFLDQVCQSYEMDYWDVLRKMATITDEETQEVL